MKTVAPFVKYSKLGTKTVDILEFFASDMPATEAASRTGISVRSVNRLYQLMRERLILLGLSDVTKDEQFINQTIESEALRDFIKARRARARGWKRQHRIIHYRESFHRFMRPAEGPGSVLYVMLNSLITVPLGSTSPEREVPSYFTIAQIEAEIAREQQARVISSYHRQKQSLHSSRRGSTN